MDDKIDKDLLAVLLLAFNGRDVGTLAHTIHAALPKDEFWKFEQEIDRATRTSVLYSWSAAGLREELAERDYEIEDDEERVWSDHVTDDLLYTKVQELELPDSAYEAMSERIWRLFEDMENEGLVIRRKKQSKEGSTT